MNISVTELKTRLPDALRRHVEQFDAKLTEMLTELDALEAAERAARADGNIVSADISQDEWNVLKARYNDLYNQWSRLIESLAVVYLPEAMGETADSWN